MLQKLKKAEGAPETSYLTLTSTLTSAIVIVIIFGIVMSPSMTYAAPKNYYSQNNFNYLIDAIGNTPDLKERYLPFYIEEGTLLTTCGDNCLCVCPKDNWCSKQIISKYCFSEKVSVQGKQTANAIQASIDIKKPILLKKGTVKNAGIILQEA